MINKVSIYINTFGNDIFLYDMDTKKNILINTNNKFEWVELDNSNFDISSIKFKLKENKFLKIKGIKSSQNVKYYWPWYDEISLTHINKKNTRNFNFDIRSMIGSFYCENFNIIDDKSSFVLVELKCKDN